MARSNKALQSFEDIISRLAAWFGSIFVRSSPRKGSLSTWSRLVHTLHSIRLQTRPHAGVEPSEPPSTRNTAPPSIRACDQKSSREQRAFETQEPCVTLPKVVSSVVAWVWQCEIARKARKSLFAQRRTTPPRKPTPPEKSTHTHEPQRKKHNAAPASFQPCSAWSNRVVAKRRSLGFKTPIGVSFKTSTSFELVSPPYNGTRRILRIL